jgi:hypothetical protein
VDHRRVGQPLCGGLTHERRHIGAASAIKILDRVVQREGNE